MKVLKFFLIPFFSLLLLILILIAALPTLISTSKGKEVFLKCVSSKIEGTIDVGSWDLNWFKGQKVNDLKITQQGEVLLSFKQFSTEETLFSLLIGRYHFGETLLDSPTLHVIEKENGEITLQHPLPKKRVSSHKKWKWENMEGHFIVSNGFLTLKTASIEEIVLSNIDLEIQNPHFKLELTGKTQQGKQQGEMSIQATNLEPLQVHAHISQFPIPLFDQLLSTPLLSSAFGKTLSTTMDIVKNKDSLTVNALIDAPNLKGNLKGTTHQGIFSMDPESYLNFTVTPTFFSELEKEQTINWQLVNKPVAIFHIKELTMPLSKDKLKWKDIQLLTTMSIERIELSHEQLGPLSVNDFFAEATTHDTLDIYLLGQIKGNKASTSFNQKVSFTSQEKFTFESEVKGLPIEFFELISEKEATSLQLIFGNTLDLTTEGSCEEGWLHSHLSLASPQLTVEGSLEGEFNKSLTFDSQGLIKFDEKKKELYGPSPEFTCHVEMQVEDALFFPHIYSKIKNAYWDLEIKGHYGEAGKELKLEDLELTATGVLFQLPLEKKLGREIILNEGLLYAVVDGSKNTIHAKVSAKTALSPFEKHRTVALNGEIKHFIHENRVDFSQAEIHAAGDVDAFPILFLNPFTQSDLDLTALFGPSLDMTFTADYSPHKDNHALVKATISSLGFETKVALSVDGTLKVVQNQPTFIHWEVTPVRYNYLMSYLELEKNNEYKLLSPFNVELTIRELTCPKEIISSLNIFLCQSGFDADISFGEISYVNLSNQERFSIVNTKGMIWGKNFSEVIQGKLGGEIVLNSNQPSTFSIQGQLHNFWTEEGKFDRERLTCIGDINLEYIPVKQISGILPLEIDTRKQIRALLGPLVNARIYGQLTQMQGPLTVDIKSSNFKGLFPLQIIKNTITLREGVEAEITLNDAINETFLKDVAPFLVTGIWSDHPIKVYIEAEGTSIPIKPYEFKHVNIKHAVVDIGRIKVRNGGEIQALMTFLEAKELSDEGVMEAWFTPIFVSLENGVTTYKRFDALFAKNVHIALWGKIDLLKNKVRMTLGIGPKTLQERFNISGLSKKDMFQVKMRGSTDNLQLDWGSAYARIGVIIAKSAGGHLGYLFGGILEQIMKALGEEETPNPTTVPFPWER